MGCQSTTCVNGYRSWIIGARLSAYAQFRTGNATEGEDVTGLTCTLRPEQIGQVVEIEERTFAQPWTVDDFEWVSRDEGAINLGLWKDETLVGYAIGAIEGAGFHLASLAIDLPYRRQGWGSRLLCASMARAATRGCQTCRLEARRSNDAALQMYQKFDFAVDGVGRRFYTKPVEDAWLLSRPLSAL
ncbi:MAG TPA: hypothetical protein DIC52_18635 [Candidatus Latescibacteria bacterium]|nr:hypothetical protein [Candidatus Latescibacterota bacterium]